MKKTLVFCFLILFLKLNNISAQSTVQDTASYPYWIEMMQDPEANFYATQSAFNKYWEHRPLSKGCGWKPFKRWESDMQFRISPNGKIPDAGRTLKAYENFMMRNSKSLHGNWVSQGPNDIPTKGYKGLGRINAIAFHPTNPDIIYIGSPSGGFWFTTTGGNSWTTTTDNLATLGVSAIAVDPLNTNVIYIGTGDRDANDAPGLGVYKSLDGGLTWLPSNTGITNATVGTLLIDPTNNQILIAATNKGIFKSVDAGLTWSFQIGGNFKQVIFKPDNPNVIYGIANGSFFRSTDKGDSWNQITAGLEQGSRYVAAVTNANPEIVYIISSNSNNGFKALYRSTNSGIQFTEMSNSPNILGWSCDGSDASGQAWYDLALIGDPIDEDIIYSGGINIWKSVNGGLTWQIKGHWSSSCEMGVHVVHADHHILAVNPLNNRIYVGNDGGIYWTGNGGTNWTEISTGLVISQTYKIGQSATDDDVVMNGYQDNGTSLFENNMWKAVIGGDGMECAIDPKNANIRYGTLYYGQIIRLNGGYQDGTIAGNNVNGINEDGAWVTPFIIDETDNNTMFVGYKNIWRSRNIKEPYVGSVKWDKISSINTTNLDVLEQSPVNTNLLYASSKGTLYVTEQAQESQPDKINWIDISKNLLSYSIISDIETSPFDENIVYIAQDTLLFKSSDKGKTWINITGNLPPIHINSITYYKNSQEGLYIGTDAGAYYKDKYMSEWIPFINGMPVSASVREMEIFYSDISPEYDRIKAGTYGRGLWKSDLYFSTPIADFITDKQIIPPGCHVNFSDNSSGVPFQWNWNLPGSTVTSSTSKNPSNIIYNTIGVYPVTLTVTNTAGTNSINKNAYIIVSDTILPIPSFSADKLSICNLNQNIHFTDSSSNCPISWQWSFTPNTVTFVGGTSASSQNPQVSFNQAGQYSVSLTVTNINGQRSITKNNYINVGGFLLPFVEDFEDNNLESRGWVIENPDNEITWATTQVVGTTPGNKAAWMNFFNYTFTGGRRDRLITPPLNFSSAQHLYLGFQHAYASRYSSSSDSLIIFVSDDCGSTWERVFNGGDAGNGTFATVPKRTTFFAPTSELEWCNGTWGSKCNIIDISKWAGKTGIMIAFEAFNKIGNNLYLDNIEISSSVDVLPINNSTRIHLYPNPAEDIVNIKTPTLYTDTELKLINSLGITLFHQNFKAGNPINTSINLEKLPKGLYIITVKGKDVNEQKKLIIK